MIYCPKLWGSKQPKVGLFYTLRPKAGIIYLEPAQEGTTFDPLGSVDVAKVPYITGGLGWQLDEVMQKATGNRRVPKHGAQITHV